MKLRRLMIASHLLMLPASLGCGLKLPSNSDDSADTAARAPGARGTLSPEKLAERARIAASGQYLAKPQAGSVSLVAPDWGAALDLPPSLVTNATLTGSPEAAAVLPSLGIIRVIRGGSFVMLSTGLAARPTDPSFTTPEPGTDLLPEGDVGDMTTLTLDLQIPPGANKLSFAYNFLSTEAPEYIGSEYNDSFSIQVIQGGVTRTRELASVNSSQFFDASDSRARNSGYDLFAADPIDVDTIFDPSSFDPPGGFPDAGLTDPQPVSMDITPGQPLRLVLSIQDGLDGILDSSVLIDDIRLSGFETIDPNSDEVTKDLIADDGTYTTNINKLTSAGRYVSGSVADGVTPVLLRLKVPEPGQVTFSIIGDSGALDGDLSTLTGGEHQATVVSQTVTATTGEYALASFQAPTDFNRGGLHQFEDELLNERTIELRAVFVSNNGGTFETQIPFQIKRPPVVLTNGLWTTTMGWDRTLADDPAYVVTFAALPYSCNVERWIALPPDGSCPWQVATTGQGRLLCDDDRGDRMEASVNESLINTRRLGMGFAATQVDLVAHGLRGIQARRYIESAAYRNGTNFGQGSINRLITLNTPHLGSRVADKMVAAREATAAGGNEEGEDFLCQARQASSAPVEPGEIDDLVTNGTALAETPVPSHAIVGRGGSTMNDMATVRRLANFFLLYATSMPDDTSALGLNKVFQTPTQEPIDHDLFSDVVSQQGGIADTATTVFDVVDNDDGSVMRDYFHSMNDWQVLVRIAELLNQPLNGGQFGNFPDSSTVQPALAASGGQHGDASLMNQEQGAALAPPGLHIVSPTSGAQVYAGSMLSVSMVAENGFVPKSIMVVVGSEATISQPASLVMPVRVPPAAVGYVHLRAFGFGTSGGVVISNDVILVSKPNEAPTSVSILTQNPILFGKGARRQITVLGQYADGVVRDITAPITGTFYTSSNTGIVTVDSNGVLTAVGSGLATVVAWNSGRKDSITVTVLANRLPIAAATGSASAVCVAPGGLVPVHLDGTASHDADGDPLQMQWFEGSTALGTGATLNVSLGVGQHLIRLQVSDGHGGLAQATVTVTIHGDGAPPVITVLGNNPVTLECGTLYSDQGATANDDCSGDLTASISRNSTVNPGLPGSYAVSYQVSDSLGQTSAASRSVTVQDTLPPSLQCPPPTVAECTGSGRAVVDPGDPIAQDTCSAVTVDPFGPASYPLGTTPITVAAHDSAGNQATCSTSVTVRDTQVPTITCPPPVTAECTGGGGASVNLGTATAADSCLLATVTQPSNGPYPVGTTPVVFTAEDKAGNQASCTSTVQVVDTIAPQVSLASPAPLWPLDHLYRTITLDDCHLVVQDTCGGTLPPSAYQARITCVSSDEPDDTPGPHDGSTVNDIVIVNDTTVRLRAERHSSFDGRVYKIGFNVRDSAGNVSSGVCPVYVPYNECKPENEQCSVVDSGVANAVCH